MLMLPLVSVLLIPHAPTHALLPAVSTNSVVLVTGVSGNVSDTAPTTSHDPLVTGLSVTLRATLEPEELAVVAVSPAVEDAPVSASTETATSSFAVLVVVVTVTDTPDSVEVHDEYQIDTVLEAVGVLDASTCFEKADAPAGVPPFHETVSGPVATPSVLAHEAVTTISVVAELVEKVPVVTDAPGAELLTRIGKLDPVSRSIPVGGGATYMVTFAQATTGLRS
jgi:hypothetical protein